MNTVTSMDGTTTTTMLGGGISVDTATEIAFDEEDGKTPMTLSQSGYPTTELRNGFKDVVPYLVEALERPVASGVAR